MMPLIRRRLALTLAGFGLLLLGALVTGPLIGATHISLARVFDRSIPFAENSDAPRALEQFQQAATADDLDSQQRAFVHESIQRIKQRSGL